MGYQVMSVADLFDPSCIHNYVFYYSQEEPGFGSLRGARTGPVNPATVPAPESVVDQEVHGGGSNVSGGAVVRRNRRKINPSPGFLPSSQPILRNYSVAQKVMFNNLDELVQDAISASFAQEILEEIFSYWGLEFSDATAMKYAEDLVFTFLIATTASDKADYNRAFDLPAGPRGEELTADFKVLSDVVTINHRLTRRQFARGLAERLRAFVRAEENAPMQAAMADRAGCQYQFGDLCFDGSTHCKGLTPSERAFVLTLEARNLFESDAVLATGASDKLLTGFNQRQAPRITAA